MSIELPLTDRRQDLLASLDTTRGTEVRWATTRLLSWGVRAGLIKAAGRDVPTRLWKLTVLGDLALLFDSAHAGTEHRRLLAGSPIQGEGNRYGVGLRCRCGAGFTSNEPGSEGKKRLRTQHREHVAAEVEKARAELESWAR